MNQETAKRVASGQWVEVDMLDNLWQEASYAWSEAERNGHWTMEVDVADLARICDELRERRAREQS